MHSSKRRRVPRAALAIPLFYLTLPHQQIAARPVLAQEEAPTQSGAARLDALLDAQREGGLDALFLQLDRLRPAAVSAADKAASLAEVPFVTEQGGGRKKCDRGMARLLRVAGPALGLHARAGVTELALFDHPDPIALSEAGVIIAVSTTLLSTADSDAALAGVIAHEIAHEYVAMEQWAARRANDFETLRKVELFCDGVAAATLLKLGLDPAEYARALESFANFSPAAAEMNSGRHQTPSPAERLAHIGLVSGHLRNARGGI